MVFLRSTLSIVCCALLLSGCLTVRFVEEYDRVLDENLTALQGDLADFVARLGVNASKPEGQYGHADVQAFYARTDIAINGFVERAEMLDEDGSCKPTEYANKGIEKTVESAYEAVAALEIPYADAKELLEPLEDDAGNSVDLEAGNCTVVILKSLLSNFRILRYMHEDSGSLPPALSSITGAIIGDTIRIAIKNELIKKTRDE